MRLKILSYNIHKGRRGHSSKLILEELKAAIDTTGADIVCLQEVQGEHRQINEPQFERLADQLWQHYAYARNAVTARGHHGNAILSRFPIQSSHNTNIAWMKGASRSILQAEILLPEQEKSLQIMCIHLGLLGIERRLQINALERRINLLPNDTPLIIAGDFNDWTGRSHRQLKRRGDLHELAEITNGELAQTFPARWPLLRVDRIYTRHCQPVSLEVPHSKVWKRLSDHLPLLGIIDFIDNK